MFDPSGLRTQCHDVCLYVSTLTAEMEACADSRANIILILRIITITRDGFLVVSVSSNVVEVMRKEARSQELS